jgi:hypothetical protein
VIKKDIPKTFSDFRDGTRYPIAKKQVGSSINAAIMNTPSTLFAIIIGSKIR